MAELKYDKSGRLLFTKEMKQEYQILMPQMLPIHFELIKNVLRLHGYNVKLLTSTDSEAIRLQGLENVDVQLLEMAKVFHLAPWKKFIYIYRPAFMPFVMSASKLALGMSWKSGIMAEVIGTPKPSIGREMYAAKTYLETSKLFAWTIVVVVLSVVFEVFFMWILKRLSAPMGWLVSGRDDGDDDFDDDEDDGEWPDENAKEEEEQACHLK